MIFGKKIKELREEHGMVQRKLAANVRRKKTDEMQRESFFFSTFASCYEEIM